jgi:uncharacterized membrane protein YqhA
MLAAFFRIRWMSVLAVFAALCGALLMFVLGSMTTIEAFAITLGLKAAHLAGGPALEATVKLLESLDQFLFGLVLVYFAYSVFFLFLAREYEDVDVRIRMPDWLKVESLGQMKKTVLEVVVVLLTVLFLKLGLETQTSLGWELLIFPVGIVAVAVSLKLISFDH